MRQVSGKAGNEMRNALRTSPNDSHLSQHETIFMGLRLLDGLEADKFKGFEKQVAELVENNLLIKENSKIKLTKRGLYLANEVFAKFI